MENTTENKTRAKPENTSEPSRLTMKIENKTYIIGLHFNENSKETLEDKVKKLIKKDVESGNF